MRVLLLRASVCLALVQGSGSAPSLTGYSFSPKAYAKAVLHSCKHSAAPVLGLLLGSANGKVLKVADAIPLFHTHALGPMLKIACMLAEEHCKATWLTL
ncbi:ER membrane protein complex subunit 8/9-like [Symbiodinium microadriaticum]|uniref:ER membrane protein complex subunit 8/9-like n=1 Tax=Symbiodinium microadriaticum TaxID=2951 RepID=A0A1Q9D7I8_SYMMI|nr:ER membrane protein complex subunit 8/9-like [Symbiodinium microadriaticum]